MVADGAGAAGVGVGSVAVVVAEVAGVDRHSGEFGAFTALGDFGFDRGAALAGFERFGGCSGLGAVTAGRNVGQAPMLRTSF